VVTNVSMENTVSIFRSRRLTSIIMTAGADMLCTNRRTAFPNVLIIFTSFNGRHGQVAKTPASYSPGPGFKSRPRDRLS
jgi:hypothetical protein